mgnify:CR=1 FL=1
MSSIADAATTRVLRWPKGRVTCTMRILQASYAIYSFR